MLKLLDQIIHVQIRFPSFVCVYVEVVIIIILSIYQKEKLFLKFILYNKQ